MRIRMTDKRERLYQTLMRTSPENTKSKAIDQAIRFYCEMHGGNDVSPGKGNIERLMQTAIKQGSVTPEQIAECLDTSAVPVRHDLDREWGVGNVDE